MSGCRKRAMRAADRAAWRSSRTERGCRVRARSARAALIVAAGFAFLAGAGGVQAQAARSMASEAASYAGFGAVMGAVGDGFSCSPSDVPEAFADELLPVAGRRGLRCDARSHLVGFEHEGSASDALREARDALERGGWNMTAAEQGLCATFSKDRGVCRWAFVQCVQTAQGSSVVVQWSECGKEGLS